MTVLKNGNDVRASDGDRIIAKSVWGIEPRMMFVHFLGGVLMKGETVNIDKGRLLCFCFLLYHAVRALRVLVAVWYFMKN